MVAIVDETLAKTYWPRQDALGQRIRQGSRGSTAPWRVIVGVVRHRALPDTGISFARRNCTWPYAQTRLALGSMSLAIHTTADPRMLANTVQKQVLALDPDQTVYRVRTMHELMAEVGHPPGGCRCCCWPVSPGRLCCCRPLASMASCHTR